MTALQLFSTLAIVLGTAGVLPQILAMIRRGSAAGQSSFGWVLGVAVNAMTGYVNVVGYDAALLALGNALSGTLCFVALACCVRLPKTVEVLQAPAVVRPDPLELSTGDLSEMLEAFSSERARREAAYPELVAA